MTQAFDEPLVVVGIDELSNALTNVVAVLVKTRPKTLLFQGTDETLWPALDDLPSITVPRSKQLVAPTGFEPVPPP